MTKILVLPGMGDIYWVFTKLQSFIDQHKLSNVVLYTWEIQPEKIERSADFIRMFPGISYGGGVEIPTNTPEFNTIYFGDEWCLTDFRDFDYVLSMNGVLRNGNTLEHGDLNEYTTDWDFPLNHPTTESYDSTIGKYVVAYFTDDGMFKQWLRYFTPTVIYNTLQRIHEETGYRVVLSGCHWDQPFVEQIQAQGPSDFLVPIFDTSVSQLFDLLKQSNGVIGWCGGNTIMSTHFKIPTLMIWSRYFRNERFFTNAVSPTSIHDWYFHLVCEDRKYEHIIHNFINHIQR